VKRVETVELRGNQLLRFVDDVYRSIAGGVVDEIWNWGESTFGVGCKAEERWGRGRRGGQQETAGQGLNGSEG
jgi:hypothetical protein